MDLSLREAVGDFLEALEAAGRAPKTIRWYRDILNRFVARGGELTWRGINRYFASRRPELADASLAGEHRCLRRFCRWLIKRKLIAENPMDEVERPTVTETVPRVATAETALLLSAMAHRGANGLRDSALVLVLADTGARLNELLRMTMDNLRIVVEDGHARGEALVIGKGRHTRRLLIGETAMTELAAWITERPPEAGAIIWWSEQTNAPLRESGVRLLLRRLSRRAGLPEDINPHAFRHGCAIDAILNGADLRTVQLILGHRHISTTVRYLHMADQLVAAAHDRISDAKFARAQRLATHFAERISTPADPAKR